jgi:hypothetical protein
MNDIADLVERRRLRDTTPTLLIRVTSWLPPRDL